MTTIASAVVPTVTLFTSSASDILSQYLVKALAATGNAVDKAVDTVSTQAPILIQEVLHWYFVYNLLCFFGGIAIIVAVVYFNIKQYKWVRAQSALPDKQQSSFYREWNNGGLIMNVFQPILLVPSCALVNFDWVKIWIAPRLWLIEYAANLVKHH